MVFSSNAASSWVSASAAMVSGLGGPFLVGSMTTSTGAPRVEGLPSQNGFLAAVIGMPVTGWAPPGVPTGDWTVWRLHPELPPSAPVARHPASNHLRTRRPSMAFLRNAYWLCQLE